MAMVPAWCINCYEMCTANCSLDSTSNPLKYGTKCDSLVRVCVNPKYATHAPQVLDSEQQIMKSHENASNNPI